MATQSTLELACGTGCTNPQQHRDRHCNGYRDFREPCRSSGHGQAPVQDRRRYRTAPRSFADTARRSSHTFCLCALQIGSRDRIGQVHRPHGRDGSHSGGFRCAASDVAYSTARIGQDSRRGVRDDSRSAGREPSAFLRQGGRRADASECSGHNTSHARSGPRSNRRLSKCLLAPPYVTSLSRKGVQRD
jgi:hypothetical protein